MRTKYIILLFIIFFQSSCATYRAKMTRQTFSSLDKSEKISYSRIIWQKDTIGNLTSDKSSILIPVKINNIDQQFYMQLDLGTPLSMLYGKPFDSICGKYQELQKDTINQENRVILKNAKLFLSDTLNISADRLYLKKDFGESYKDNDTIIIGTLGFDLLGDNILILDFKTNRMGLSNDIPKEMESEATFISNTDLISFPIILPFQLGTKKIRLFYDTGSSSFPILTGFNRLKKVSKQRKTYVIDSVNSWGNQIPIHTTHEIKDKFQKLTIENIDLGNPEIYGYKGFNKLKWTGNYLYGITGNIIFDNKILIIDRKNNRFGIIE